MTILSTSSRDTSSSHRAVGTGTLGRSHRVSDSYGAVPGQSYDPESGYNHNGFRDYAGTFTRYVESDPIGLSGGMNTYQYVDGNPFKWTDRNGLLSWAERQIVPDSVVNNAKNIISSITGGSLTPDQINDLVDSILHHIDYSDACKFASIRPSSNGTIITQQQSSIIQDEIDEIEDPNLKAAAQSAYDSAKDSKKVLIQ